MEDDVQPVILDDPGRLRALSHPLRRRILDRLQAHGPATSTTLGEALGRNTGTTSYHLRQLEKSGFVEEIPERSTGRERWWRRAPGPRDVRTPAYDTLPPQDRPVLAELIRLANAEDVELLRSLPTARDRSPDWAGISRGSTHMTADELAAFREDYLRLLRRYGHGPEDAPAGARPLHVRLFTLPADGRTDDDGS
jgi:DNA-binding transcriptional ArsR family regulator